MSLKTMNLSLQETSFIHYIENILTHQTMPKNESEQHMKQAYLKVYMHLDTATELKIEKIREYRYKYAKLFKEFYICVKKVRVLFMDIAPTIVQLKFSMVPSIKTLIGYYTQMFEFQMYNAHPYDLTMLASR